AITESYTLSLHDALPICVCVCQCACVLSSIPLSTHLSILHQSPLNLSLLFSELYPSLCQSLPVSSTFHSLALSLSFPVSLFLALSLSLSLSEFPQSFSLPLLSCPPPFH